MCSEIMAIGGFNPSAANLEAHAGWVQGIPSCRKPKPKAPPQPGDPCSRIRPTPGTPLPRQWGQSAPPSTYKARYAEWVLPLIYGSVIALI